MSVLGNLREANLKRQKEWQGNKKTDLSFRGLEMMGEAGEACNVIKKLERERMGFRGSRDTVEHLAEELADVLICLDLIAIECNIDLERSLREKFNATSLKYGLSVMMEEMV